MQRGMLDELSAIISNSCHPVHSQQSLLSSRLFLSQCTREHVHRLLFSMSIRLFTTALSLSLSILSAIWITNLSYSQNCSQKLRAFAAFITEKKSPCRAVYMELPKFHTYLGIYPGVQSIVLLSRVCMFSLCPCGFPQGFPVSFHHPEHVGR